MDPAVINLNEAAQLIEEMGGKVLNPIRIDDTSMFDSIDQPLFAFVDVETTGFTPGEDEIIQLSIVGAKFDGDRILGRKLLYSSYNEPTKEIPELIREMTGISYETVKGQSIDWQEVDLPLHCLVAHAGHLPDQLRDSEGAKHRLARGGFDAALFCVDRRPRRSL